GWSEGEGDHTPEHPQQHGWIVGDSHKKLVTMLAHAKGRKRSYDDNRQVLE
ncbi:jg17182, partial [Pararge aegeria aegeria]